MHENKDYADAAMALSFIPCILRALGEQNNESMGMLAVVLQATFDIGYDRGFEDGKKLKRAKNA